ncbi:hypothetical protein ACHAW5_008893 [Stephanodiscus triporus]|uniref:Uncharacterized protein n=1 Tax=Stephanodiscus triporus TaxID=2934178 RepID=A0ABD3N4Z2_9STRA
MPGADFLDRLTERCSDRALVHKTRRRIFQLIQPSFPRGSADPDRPPESQIIQILNPIFCQT